MTRERTENQTLNIVSAGLMLGIGRTTAYTLARFDRFPVPVFRVGHQLRVSRAAIEELLDRRKGEVTPHEAAA